MGETFPTIAEMFARMNAKRSEFPNPPVKLPDGWTLVPPFGAMGFAVLVRESDGKNFRASADSRLWEKQILDFEFMEGTEWTDEQIAAMVKPGTVVAVPDQAVHLGIDSVCINGRSQTCAEGFRRLGLDRKTPWMALPASEPNYAAGDVISLTDGGHQPLWIGVDLASGPDKTAYLSYRTLPIERSGRPSPPPAAEIPVTDEMHAVGLAEYELCQDVTTIYRAMRPLEPMQVTPGLWNDQSVKALMADRDQLQEMLGLTKGWRGVASIGSLRLADGSWGDCVAVHRQDWEDACAGKLAPGPVTMLSAVEDREKAREENQALGKLYCETTERNIELNGMIERQARALGNAATEIALLRQALAMKDARIGEFKSVLASTPVAFEDPDAKPEPEINPFRNFGHDPQRMGPL